MSNISLKEKWAELKKDKKKFAVFLLLLLLFTCGSGLLVMKSLGVFNKNEQNMAENNIPTPQGDSANTNENKLNTYNDELKLQEASLNEKQENKEDFDKLFSDNSKPNNNGNTDYSNFGNSNKDYLVKSSDANSNSSSSTSSQSDNKSLRSRTKGTTNQDAIVYSQNQISAVVHNWGREIRSGSNVRIRTTEEFKANGIVIPKNTNLYAVSSASGERMHMTITGANLSNEVVPLSLEVYDNDGVLGIHIPTHLQREVANDIVTNATENTKTTVKLGTIGEVTTNVGKKTQNNPNIIVNDGYRIFLKPKKN